MKYLHKIGGICFSMILLLTLSCNKVLVEQNKSNITPGIFSTPLGLQAGLTASYSNLRFLFGQEPQLYVSQAGTDEVLRGAGATTQAFFYNIQTTDGDVANLWNTSYQSINTLNGVIANGPNAELPAATKATLVAEAKFTRAFYYFMLVQTFGDVSLHLEFNTNPSVSDSRQPIADVYTAIIKDLTDAIPDLPNTPAQSKGHASKPAALFLLAKVYLTRGWSAASQNTDFQNAYLTALSVINDKATYNLDLWQDFADVNKEGNEYGKEVLWVIDRNTNSKSAETNYTGGSGGSPNNGNKENRSSYYYRPNYPSVTLNVNMGISGGSKADFIMMDRDIANGRPWQRIRPSDYALNIAFGDKVNDSRFNKSFQTTWIYNRGAKIAADIAAATGRGAMINGVDTSIWMAGTPVSESRRRAFKGVILTSDVYPYTDLMYPSLSKYDDLTRLVINDPSDRPFIMFKFSELYLIAAEAAFKGGASMQDAANMINVLRHRAAYRSNNSEAQNAAAESAQTITEGDITINLILDEYSRELFGEWRRWYDLVRTKTLGARIAAYNPEAAPGFESPKHLLKPIPQSQIDLVTEGPAYPQNPGY